MSESPQDLVLEPLVASDSESLSLYNRTFTSVWPEFAMTDEEFRNELEVSGPARHWIVRDSGGDENGEPIGVLAVERVRWNPDDSPPIAFALLVDEAQSAAAYRQLLRAASQFALELKSEQLRVLLWDREHVLRELVSGLAHWHEATREIDVGLDPQQATDWERAAPDGFTVTTLAERPELKPSAHACLTAAIEDVPGDELEQVPPFEEWERGRAGSDRPDDAYFVAVDAAGTVAGIAELARPALHPEMAWHGYTAVHPDFRGAGLARALKSATIAYARERGLRQLRTENDETNAGMRHINAQLGYGPVSTRMLWRGPVSALL